MSIRTSPRWLTSAIVIMISLVGFSLVGFAAGAQPREHVDVPRDQWQRVTDTFRELGAIPGSHVADIGAGAGHFTRRLSAAVGPSAGFTRSTSTRSACAS